MLDESELTNDENCIQQYIKIKSLLKNTFINNKDDEIEMMYQIRKIINLDESNQEKIKSIVSKNEVLMKFIEKLNRLYMKEFSISKPLHIQIKRNTEPPVNFEYLKRTILQFFLQDDQMKGELIPLIMELLGCSNEQKIFAQRLWQRTHQQIGLFGL